jgi:hypothetical protein
MGLRSRLQRLGIRQSAVWKGRTESSAPIGLKLAGYCSVDIEPPGLGWIEAVSAQVCLAQSMMIRFRAMCRPVCCEAQKLIREPERLRLASSYEKREPCRLVTAFHLGAVAPAVTKAAAISIAALRS